MDDDAKPHVDALESILAKAKDANCIYGSATIDGDRLAWPMKARNSKRNGAIFDPALLHTQMDVEFVPFLGMIVHRVMIDCIGVLDAGTFFTKDEEAHCNPARALKNR